MFSVFKSRVGQDIGLHTLPKANIISLCDLCLPGSLNFISPNPLPTQIDVWRERWIRLWSGMRPVVHMTSTVDGTWKMKQTLRCEVLSWWFDPYGWLDVRSVWDFDLWCNELLTWPSRLNGSEKWSRLWLVIWRVVDMTFTVDWKWNVNQTSTCIVSSCWHDPHSWMDVKRQSDSVL